MDDETALRVEQVKLAFQTKDRLIDLRARRQVATLAVALTSLVSVVGAGLTGLLGAPLVAVLAAMLAFASISQIWALRQLGRELVLAGEEAAAGLESLMAPEDEHGNDASA